MEAAVLPGEYVHLLDLVADLKTSSAENTELRIPHDGGGTPVVRLAAETLVVAVFVVQSQGLGKLLEVAFPVFRADQTVLWVPREDELQKVASRLQHFRGGSVDHHALRHGRGT